MSAGNDRLPVGFVGHGNPLNVAIEERAEPWRAWGRSLPHPRAVLTVSAHWEDAAIAHGEQRPPRRYYELTAAGHAVLATAVTRYPVPRSVTARLRRLRPARSS